MKISKILILFAALLPIAVSGVPLDLATSGDNNAQRRTKNNANFNALNDGKVELLGSMTEAARDLLTPGLWDVILNTTADELQVWDGGAWRRVDGMDAASVKTLYESNADTNALTDALKAKLDFLTITQAVDLDTLEGDVATNSAKSSGHTIQDDGSGLAQETVLDFQGAGVTVTPGSGKTIVTIPGGGGAFDAAAQDALTWSDGANASNIWTFDVSGIDPTMTFGNGLITIGADLAMGGNDITGIGNLNITNLIMSGDMELPNGAAPVVDTDGQVALDTTVADLSHGVIRYFGGEEMVVIAIPTAELGSLADGVIPKYNATTDEFELVADETGAGSSVEDDAYGPGWNGDTANAPSQNAVYDQMELRAPIASPALTGNPTAPTPAASDNDTSVATTAYVQGEISRDKINTVSVVGSFTSPITTNPYTLTAPNMYGGNLFYGATGEIDLPAGVAGMNRIIYNTGAFTITIDPNGSEAIVRDGTAQTGGVSFTLSAGAGNYVGLLFDGTQWVTLGYKGTLAEGS